MSIQFRRKSRAAIAGISLLALGPGRLCWWRLG